MKAIITASFVADTTLSSAESRAISPATHRALYEFLSRDTRLSLRVTTPKKATRDIKLTDADIDQQAIDRLITDWLAIHDPLNDKPYYAQNTVDPDMDITGADEFGDIDNELDGLTITDPMDEVALFEFCTGYNVI